MLSSPGVSSHLQDTGCTGCCGNINNAVPGRPGRFITNKPANAGGEEEEYEVSYCESAETRDQCLGVGFDPNIPRDEGGASAAAQSSAANTSADSDKWVSYKTRFPNYCQWNG